MVVDVSGQNLLASEIEDFEKKGEDMPRLELHDMDCCALLSYLLHIVGDRFNQLGFRWCMR